MAVGDNERSPKPSRKSSKSSSSKTGVAKPATLRAKPLPRDPGRPRTPSTTEESSLTSFPSLSPSLENSPVNSPHSSGQFHSLSVPTDQEVHQKTTQHGQLNGLFAGSYSQDGRSALFEDSPKHVGHVPGTLHLQSQHHLEHLIRRVGAVPLVKQMAEDLAQRDAQMTHLQRRAEERERLLRKMLGECEVSNLKIENRLKELEEEQAVQEQTKKPSAKTARDHAGAQAEASIDEQMSEAFVDILGGSEARNGEPEARRISQAHGTSSTTPVRRVSAEMSRNNIETIRKKGTGRGWRSFFGAQSTEKQDQGTIHGPLHRATSAQERLQRIHTASQADLKRRGLSSDLFRPPPAVSSQTSSRKSSMPIDGTNNATENGNDDSEATSTKSAYSLASWATRLVGGKTPSDSRLQSQEDIGQPLSRSTTADTTSSKTRAQRAPTSGVTGTVKPRAGSHLNTAVNQTRMDSKSPISSLIPGSPADQASINTANLGPMEMDTILPDSSRPPTLLPYEGKQNASEYLTDRYGFIYDQRRRARQNMAATSAKGHGKRGSRVETLGNHRKSWNSLANRDGDTASIMSQKSSELADTSQNSPVSGEAPADSKKWQDYLKLSSISTELLSHTPSVAPTTTVIAGEEPTAEVAKPDIKVSRHGSIVAPTTISEPAQSEPPSAGGETASVNELQGVASTTAADVQSSDPVKALLDQLTDIHDASQREKESRWNDFLRKVGAERRRRGEAYSNDRRAKNLTAIPEASLMDGEIIGITSLGIEGKAGQAKWIEFKNLLLGGIPVSLRPKVWAECSGALSSRVPGYYEEMVRSPPRDEVIIQQIAMDIPRTLTDNIYFRTGDGMAKLSEVLLAYSQRNPDVGYCQGMNLITANLLLIMPTAEDAFWMLSTLIEKILPDKYYDHSLLTSRADQAVLRQYVGTVLPNLSNHLEQLSVDLEALTFQWFLSVFTDCLSAEALFRVWDVMLCTPSDAGGGANFLFQVALALLKLNEKQLLACESSAEVYAYINGKMTDHAISIDGLIRASEALRKVVKREDVERKREAVVQADLELTRQRDAIRKGKARANIAVVPEVGKDVETEPRGELVPEEAPVRPTELPPNADVLEEDTVDQDLEQITPMPIEEEMQWRA